MKLKNKSKQAKTVEAKKQDLLSILKNQGLTVYNDLNNGKFPQFAVPSRSVSNIVYDKKLRQYILGKAAAVRSARNMSQLRSFTQLAWLAFFVNRLVNEGKTSTLRDIYYSSQAFEIDLRTNQNLIIL